jgi:hypothetical protein
MITSFIIFIFIPCYFIFSKVFTFRVGGILSFGNCAKRNPSF